VQSYVARSAQLEPQTRERLAATIALRIRPSVPGASDFADDDLFLVAVAEAISVPATSDPPTATAPGSFAELVREVDRRLDALVRGGALDTAAANRLRHAMRRELDNLSPSLPATAPPVVPVTTVKLETPPPAPPVPQGPSAFELLFSPEHAPSLLLYVGAFLVVMAALIFVNVSREQISDVIRIVLMFVGTFAFLGGGLLCYRIPRVQEAGRTFLMIGALLVPLDVAAYYALVVRESPLSSPAMWGLGSLVAAGLYATLALRSYGTAYAYLFFAACLSAVGGLEAWIGAPAAWFGVPFAALALAIDVVDIGGRGRAVWRLTAPLELPSRVLMTLALVLGALDVAVAAQGAERLAMPVLVLVGSAYYAIRADLEIASERWLVAAAPAALGLAIVFAAAGPMESYGLVLAALAVAYALADDLDELATQPSPLPRWARDRARPLAYACATGALLPVTGYWGAPAAGASAYLVVAALFAVLAVRRAFDARSTPTERAGLVFAAASVGHVGALYLLVAARVIHAGVAPFAGLLANEVALAYAPLAAALALAATVARRRAPTLFLPAATAAVASATVAVTLALGDPRLATILASLAAAAVVAGAADAGRPRALWLAAAFAAVGAWSGASWLDPPAPARPLLLGGAALAVFVPAFLPRYRTNPFARVARQIAVATAAAGVATGFELAFAIVGPALPWDTPVWLATSAALSLFGAITVAEGLHRRSEDVVLLASACFPGSALMVIARLHPGAIEAYALPVAAYFALVAIGIARYGSVRLRSDYAIGAQVVAAVALIAPTALASWGPGEHLRSIVVLVEGLALLAFASGRGLTALSTTALATLAAGLVRTAGDPLGLELPAAVVGVATLALTLTAPPSLAWRVDLRLRELAEVTGVLLMLGPAFVRATAFGADALPHGAAVLGAGVLIVALGLWSGRRALLATAAAMLAAMGVIAVRDTRATEPYVAAAGVAVLALALAVPRYLQRRLPAGYDAALALLAAALVASGALARTFQPDGEVHAARALAEAIGIVALGLGVGRRELGAIGLAAAGAVSLWILGDPAARQFHAIGAGTALVAVSLAAVRYAAAPDRRVLLGAEWLGAFLFITPTVLASWNAPFFPTTVVVFFEIALLLGTGVVLGRRWLVAAALAATGLEAVRATVDIVNRLPNWALFGTSGAILLAAGFVLLLKREAWTAWSQQMYRWWARL